jgi:PhnB protein
MIREDFSAVAGGVRRLAGEWSLHGAEPISRAEAISSGQLQRQTGDDQREEKPMAFHPYLFFGGNCREAFTRYQEIFGGELFLMRMADAPAEEEVPADQADLIIHAALTINGDLLMASDDPTSDGGAMKGISISYTTADVADAKRVFDALADGGQVTQALTETFFSPQFGMCVDRFGAPWMVMAEAPQPAS